MSKTYGFSPRELKDIREEVRKRDNYQCFFCHKDIRKVSLRCSVHHIIPKAFLKERHFEPSNLITICFLCHNQLEKLNKVLLRFFLNREDWNKIRIFEKLNQNKEVGA